MQLLLLQAERARWKSPPSGKHRGGCCSAACLSVCSYPCGRTTSTVLLAFCLFACRLLFFDLRLEKKKLTLGNADQGC